MKKVVLVSLFITSCFTSYTQTEETPVEKKVKFGFNIGANYSNLVVPSGLPLYANISEGLALRLGIISEINIAKFLSFSPKAELCFNKNNVTVMDGTGAITSFQEMPVSLDIMAHFNFFKGNGKLSPYLFIGPNLKKPIEEKPLTPPAIPNTKTNLAIDFGIGFDRTFSHFNFAPELRYSYGVIDVSRQSLLPSLYHHNISLVINFLG